MDISVLERRRNNTWNFPTVMCNSRTPTTGCLGDFNKKHLLPGVLDRKRSKNFLTVLVQIEVYSSNLRFGFFKKIIYILKNFYWLFVKLWLVEKRNFETATFLSETYIKKTLLPFMQSAFTCWKKASCYICLTLKLKTQNGVNERTPCLFFVNIQQVLFILLT